MTKTSQEYLNLKLGLSGHTLSKQQALNRLAAIVSSGSTANTAQEAAAVYNGQPATSLLSVQGSLNRKVGITGPTTLSTEDACSRL